MKIAILSHFGSFQAGYALHVGWLERARLLKYFDQDFDFLVNEQCKDAEIYPHVKKCLGNISTNKPFNERVHFFEEMYKKTLMPYDIVLTPDLIYQKKNNFLAQNQAMRNAAKKLKCKWFHWIHSAWIVRPFVLSYPESLRFTPMENSTIVYMNESEKAGVARMYDISRENVSCVYNPKDYRSFNDFHPLSWTITRILDIPNKNVVQIFPHCSTRMDAKGIDAIVRVHAALKRQGASVALVFANANGRKVEREICAKKAWIKTQGLVEGQDFFFTSDITEWAPFPRKAVSDIFNVANLFVFASWREVSPNVLLEAKISGNLLVLGNLLPCSAEYGGPDAIYFDSTAKTPGVQDGHHGDLLVVTYRDEKNYFDSLALQIMNRLPSRKHLWEFSYEQIWHEQLRPLLYGADR
ncbi:MAG: hypothetical protein SV375_02715 [Thermodesulfobacteriota bacterium]|nr:hypothetical protein [Thermodesulfobacteriota bacterium]